MRDEHSPASTPTLILPFIGHCAVSELSELKLTKQVLVEGTLCVSTELLLRGL